MTSGEIIAIMAAGFSGLANLIQLWWGLRMRANAAAAERIALTTSRAAVSAPKDPLTPGAMGALRTAVEREAARIVGQKRARLLSDRTIEVAISESTRRAAGLSEG